MKKIFLCDFDETIVQRDILDVVCGLVGKAEESQKLINAYIKGEEEGLSVLKKRIDLLKGISLSDIEQFLKAEPYLRKGAKELFRYLKENGYISVLCSGNIMPILNYYKELLNIDYVVGSSPRIINSIIQGIELADFNGNNFKFDGCADIIKKEEVAKENIIAMGDSPSDLGMFGLAGTTIAVNPKGVIETKITYTIDSDLTLVIDILRKL